MYVQNQKGEKSVFTTTLTLEERIASARAQLTKARENRRIAYEKAAKAEKKIERLIAKRPEGTQRSAEGFSGR